MRRLLKATSWIGAMGLMALLLAPAGSAHTSLRTYWLAIPESYDAESSFSAALEIVSGTTATYRVTTSDAALTVTGMVRPNSPAIVALPAVWRVRSSESVEDKGIRVTSNAPIGVALLMDSFGSRGKTTIHPFDELGTSYIAMGYPESVPGDSSGFSSVLTIVGTEGGTSVDVTPACTGTGGAPAGVEIDVELTTGQTWQLRCESSQDVTGSIVSSDKPVAVFAGNSCAVIGPGSYCDQVIEQMSPVGRWGKSFYLAPVADSEPDLIRLLAGNRSASLTMTGVAQGFPSSLNPGQYVDVSLDSPIRVVSSEPIYIAQFTRGQANQAYPGDPSMVIAEPPSRWFKNYRFLTPPDSDVTKLTMVRPDRTTIRLDGELVGGFTRIPGGTHSYKQVDIQPGQHVIRASAPIAAYVHGLSQSEANAFAPGRDPVKGGTKTTLGVKKTARKVKGAGRVKPDGKGRMEVTLSRKVDGKWKALSTKRPPLSETSRYAVAFERPAPGSCKMRAGFKGDPDHKPSSTTTTFSC